MPTTIRRAPCAALATALLLALPAAAQGQQTPDHLLGSPVPEAQAERSIVIGPDVRWANVQQGESIRFVVGERAFGWRFDGVPRSFDLRRVAPDGLPGRPFTVYITPHPTRSRP